MMVEMERVQPTKVNFPAYLKKNIGKKVGIDFIVGTGKLVHKAGILKDVGPDFVAITNPNGSTTLADLFSVKFVDIF
jgi:ferredoxin-fold anticodon binding domain-containing protein